MYPRAFHYHRAASLKEASTMLLQLGEEAKLLAGGQSLIPLMKLRFASPKHLVDLNFISGTSYIKEENGALRFGALTRHAEVEYSASAAKLPILHDCASGIADVQVRNRGTIGGSLAEADPSGDWATVGLTPIKSNDAETALRGQRITEKAISAAVESARAAADPQSDMRGSAEYKRTLVGTLVKRAIEIAVQRAGGKQVEVSHIYA